MGSDPEFTRSTTIVAGDVQDFAVTATLLSHTENDYVRVVARIWIAGEALASDDDDVVLSMFKGGLERFVASADARHCLPYYRMDAREILNEIWDRSYPAAREPTTPLEVGIAARKYVLSEASLSLLDSGWRVVTIRYSNEERFVWDKGEGTRLRDERVSARRVTSAIDSFLAWADSHLASTAPG